MPATSTGSSKWLRPPWVVFALPVIVTVALVPSAFYSDERFKVYMHAVEYEGSLLMIVGDVLGEFESFMNFGNFRPLARILERFEHTVAFEVSMATGLPPHISHGLFRIAGVVTLSVAVTWLVARLEAGPRRSSWRDGGATALMPVIAAGSMLGLSSQSPFVLFPFLYLMSTAIVLATSALLIRQRNHSIERIRGIEGVGLVSLGAALAVFNEVTYLAVPIALVVVVVAWWLHATDVHLASWRGMRSWIWMTAGFAVVFVPLRIMIAMECAGGSCYAASDLSLSLEAIGLWVDRIAGSSFLVGWAIAVGAVGDPFTPGPGTLVTNWGLVVLSALLIVGAAVVARSMERSPRKDPRRLPVGLMIVGAGIVGFSSALAALSLRLQEADPRVGAAWRESALSAMGWAIIAVAVLLLVSRWSLFRGRRGTLLIGAGLSVFLIVGLYANTASASRLRNDPESALHIQVSSELVASAATAEANVRRCGLLDELGVVYAAKGNDVTSTRYWVNRASELAIGRPFCAEG